MVFAGTPDSALPALRALWSWAEVPLVVTRPPKPRGRSGTPRPSPVGEWAEAAGIPVATPTRRPELAEVLREVAPLDAAVVVAYGMIIPPDALAIPTAGWVNLHFSLLPRWRGAAPVARAILAGDPVTGVTLMLLDEGLDTGPVIAHRSLEIRPEEDAGALTDRLAALGADLLTEMLPAYLAGQLTPVPQPAEGVTYAEKIRPEERLLDVHSDPSRFVRQVRALAPRPGGYLLRDGERMAVLAAREEGRPLDSGRLELAGDRLLLGVGGRAVELVTVQPAGKRPMSGAAWARGRHGELGRLG